MMHDGGLGWFTIVVLHFSGVCTGIQLGTLFIFFFLCVYIFSWLQGRYLPTIWIHYVSSNLSFGGISPAYPAFVAPKSLCVERLEREVSFVFEVQWVRGGEESVDDAYLPTHQKYNQTNSSHEKSIFTLPQELLI